MVNKQCFLVPTKYIISKQSFQSGENLASDGWTWNDAAKKGHLHIIKWLHTHRHERYTFWAMNLAAGEGHLHVVQWLHEHQYEEGSEYAAHTAAFYGHLDVVIFLYEHYRNIVNLAGALEFANRNRQMNVVEYLKSVSVRKQYFSVNLMNKRSSSQAIRVIHK